MDKKTKNIIKRFETVFSVGLEPVIGVYGNEIVMCNSPAEIVFGRNLCGTLASDIVPDFILNGSRSDMDSYICNDIFGGKEADASVTNFDGLLVIKLAVWGEKQPTIDIAPALTKPIRENAQVLKTALTNITHYLESIKETALDTNIQSANKAVYILTRYVENLDLLSSLQSKEHSTEKEWLSLQDLCDELINSVAPLIADLDIDIRFNHDSYDKNCNEQILYINANRVLIERMLMCLLTNSVKSIKRSGQISMELKHIDKYAQLIIKDTGAGIPINKLSIIYSQHTRASELVDIAEGTKLGLRLAKEIAMFYGGSLVVRSSNEDEGALICVNLPVSTDKPISLHTPIVSDLSFTHILTEFSNVIEAMHFDGRYFD